LTFKKFFAIILIGINWRQNLFVSFSISYKRRIGMRDKNRIRPFLNEIADIWEKEPDVRFMQWICNMCRQFGTDFFYTEDEDMIKYIKEYFKEE
jgi:hypothetical protein